MLREAVRKVAVQRIAPRVAEIDESMEVPGDIEELVREIGILGTILLKEYGGVDHTSCHYVFQLTRSRRFASSP